MFEEKRSFLSPFTTVEGGFVIIVLKVAREEAFFGLIGREAKVEEKNSFFSERNDFLTKYILCNNSFLFNKTNIFCVVVN
jgi:hypothetical protein